MARCALMRLIVDALRASGRYHADSVTIAHGREAAWRTQQLLLYQMHLERPALLDLIDDTAIGNLLWIDEVATDELERSAVEDWIARLLAWQWSF